MTLPSGPPRAGPDPKAGTRPGAGGPRETPDQKDVTLALLGILVAFHHHSALAEGVDALDPNLLNLLAADGHAMTQTSRLDLLEAAGLPPVEACDLWILSGTPAWWDPGASGIHPDLLQFVREASARRTPIYATYHGEHILHDAMAPAQAPDTRRPV